MAAIPFWADFAEAWDYCRLGEDILPGICEVSFENPRDVDKKKSKGKDGRTLTDNGSEGASGEIRVTIWTADQWDEWQTIRPKIDPRKAGALKYPISIVHPMAADAGVDVIYVKNIKAQQPKRGGTYVAVISVEQWFPAPKPTKTSNTPDEKARRYQGSPAPIPLDAVEGLPGLRNPDGTVMDLGEDPTDQSEAATTPETDKGPSMFDKFGFGSTEPGTATGE